MNAREYAKLRNLPYGLVLKLCREGKIPALQMQKYHIDPAEADAAIEKLKVSVKMQGKKKKTDVVQAVPKKSGTFLENLKAAGYK